MSQYISLRLKGKITAVTQLATSPKDTPSGTPAASPESKPPSPLPRISITVGVETAVLVPYFPGSGIRGVLRRKCEEVIRFALVGEDGPSPFGVVDAYYLRNGGIKDSKKEDKADFLEADKRRQSNPLIALFGAGVPWHMGRLSVGHAVPIARVKVDVVRGVRRDDFGSGGDALVALSSEGRQEWLEMQRRRTLETNDRSQLTKLNKDFDKTKDEAKKQELQIKINALTAQIKKEVSVLQPLNGYEAIPRGTQLDHDFTLLRVREHEVGLFLAGLQRLANEPFVGAHRAHGCGIISGEWDVYVRRGDLGQWEPAGRLMMKPFEGIEVPEALATMKDAFSDAIQSGKFDFRAPQ